MVHDTMEDFFHHHYDSIQWHQHLLTIDEFEIKLEYQKVFVSVVCKKKKEKKKKDICKIDNINILW